MKHDELEELKRAWLKSEKKRGKAAQKETGKAGDEGCEVSRLLRFPCLERANMAFRLQR
jgi:hypothetical protein